MPDRLEVDLDGLEAFAANLESIRARLDATRDFVRGFEDDLGSGKVADAMDHFEGHWSDGRKKIDANAGTLASMASESVKAYRQADDQLRASLEESMNSGGGQ